MKEDNKKVIMVDGKQSEWYEKAIFIMRGDINTENKKVDFVKEAEKIINSYMIKNSYISEKSSSTIKSRETKKSGLSNRELNIILNVALILSLILLGITIWNLLI